MSVAAALPARSAWGFLGAWERSKLRQSAAADISRSSRMSAQYILGDTQMQADLLALDPMRDSWFWSIFAGRASPHQICAALVPAQARLPTGWTVAGLQLVLTAAARQARPGASHAFVLRALEQAFLAETVVAGGIAATRLRAELLGPGIALTGSGELIDEVASELGDSRAVDPLLVERSRYLSGDW